MRPRCLVLGLGLFVLGAAVGVTALFASSASQGVKILTAASEWYSSSPDMRQGICDATEVEGTSTVAETLSFLGRGDTEWAWELILESEC
jgi:hypothetical protein